MTATDRQNTQRPHGKRAACRRQQGGTLAGLIIGLIIGLLVAVGVAMTIMKSPLPFVDKLGKQAQPAGELGDPNKTLPGGARERREHLDEEAPAARQPSPPLPAAAPAAGKKQADPATPAAPATAPEKDHATATGAVRTEKAAAATPGVGNAPATPAGPPANPATGGGDAFTYYLQAGAFRELPDAEATKARLAMMGVAASIAERKSEIGTLYRVRVGPFADVEAMNRARVRLSDNGVDAAVVRVPK
jgi:cell division protein FtsN